MDKNKLFDMQDDLKKATGESLQANEELKRAMRVDKEMFDRVDELMKGACDIKTPIITKDGELVVLYSSEPFTHEEIEELKQLTRKEFNLLMRISNFKEYQI